MKYHTKIQKLIKESILVDVMSKILVTIPAFNEENTIKETIDEINAIMENRNYDYLILVVDDGSSDKTAAIAKSLPHTNVVSHPINKGLAETFRTMMKVAKSIDNIDIIINTDADGQYPAKHIPAMVDKFNEGYDLVLGSRFNGGKYSGSIGKRLGNIMFSKTFSAMLKVKLTDTTTGFRAFNKKVASLPLINKFTYTQEQLIRSAKAGLKIGEVDIETRETRPSRLFSNPFNYAIRAWTNILRIYRDFAPIKFFGIIGLTLMGLGGFVGLFVVANLLFHGNVGGIPRVILSALCLLGGLQVTLFGFLADMIGVKE